MAKSNTRVRLSKVLSETGGSFVTIQRRSEGGTRYPGLEEEQAWLERHECPGFFCFDSYHMMEAGRWEIRVAISDPNTALEFKMRFA